MTRCTPVCSRAYQTVVRRQEEGRKVTRAQTPTKHRGYHPVRYRSTGQSQLVRIAVFVYECVRSIRRAIQATHIRGRSVVVDFAARKRIPILTVVILLKKLSQLLRRQFGEPFSRAPHEIDFHLLDATLSLLLSYM